MAEMKERYLLSWLKTIPHYFEQEEQYKSQTELEYN
jgi:hypothetical protein